MYKEVARHLGNTPAVCRASYVHPRIVDLFHDGHAVAADLDRLGAETETGQLATQGPIETAVLDLLAGPPKRRRSAPPRRGAESGIHG
jgi:DNA topoisomerase-1